MIRQVTRVVCHKQYDERTVENDIALVLLQKAFPLNNNIKRVIVPMKFPVDKSAFVAGWGITDVSTNKANFLNHFSL
jgi:hypothetical protein